MTPDNTTEQHDQQQQTGQVDQKARRKFLTQAGIGSLPVLMSLKSGDAWGCVPLNCTGGDGNWSGTASAVASVQKKEIKDIVPIFDSVATIIRVVQLDLGVVSKDVNTGGMTGYLWDHLRSARYKNSNNKFQLFRQRGAVLGNLTAAQVNTLVTRCEAQSPLNNLYFSKNYSTDNSPPLSSAPPRLTLAAPKRPLLKPIIYEGKVICSNTKMSDFFPQMTTTLLACLNSDNPFEKYVTAAFVGALWQNAYIWDTDYAGSAKSAHKPNCYPTIEVLMRAYRNVIANASARNITPYEASMDMGRMFQAYTKPR